MVAFDVLLNLLNSSFPSNKGRHYLDKKNYFIKEFKEYISFLQRFERSIRDKKKQEKALQQRFLNEKSDQITLIGDLLLRNIDSSLIKKKVKKLFRKCIGKWAYQSQIMKRSFEKPRGYAGDYKIIEMFYDHKPVSKGIGYYFDKYILGNTLATADIYRKDKMIELLKDFIEKNNSKKIEIINLGCGGCRELRDLFRSYSPNKKVNFIAVDQDLEALKFSESFINDFPTEVSVNFLCKNIIDLINIYRHKNPSHPLVNKQLVYSIGLVDYFANNTLQLFIRFCLKTLVPQGQLIFAHKNREKWKSFLAPDWFCDWRFYQRDKDEVLRLIKNEIVGCDLKIKWEKTHHMFFFIITKKDS